MCNYVLIYCICFKFKIKNTKDDSIIKSNRDVSFPLRFLLPFLQEPLILLWQGRTLYKSNTSMHREDAAARQPTTQCQALSSWIWKLIYKDTPSYIVGKFWECLLTQSTQIPVEQESLLVHLFAFF